jgi:hypothetical protein
MERFSYPDLAAAQAESAEIVRLMEVVRLGTPDPGEGGDEWLG